MRKGFTLIELSIVLVIIGLIVGGVLVGRDLISAAAVRAQVTQIEKYNTAANTFRGKYGYLPGDIPAGPAAQFGFAARGAYAGEGDGNGVVQGVTSNSSNANMGGKQLTGETVLFWRDLSAANMVDGSFTTASATGDAGVDVTNTSTPNLSAYFPTASIGNGNYVYAWSGGWLENTFPSNGDSVNYFGLSLVTSIAYSSNKGRLNTTTGLTVSQAYNIDKKMDDGMPQSGSVLALHLNGNLGAFAVWAAGSGQGASSSNAPTTTATSGSATTCYDNGNVAGTQQYSLTQSGGNNVNCALSFAFQ